MSSSNRISLLDKTVLTDDQEEQRILADRIDEVVSLFLTRDARLFNGWDIRKCVVSVHSIEYILVPPPDNGHVTMEHMNEVYNNLPPAFSLIIPVSTRAHSKSKSVFEVRECTLKYDIPKGETDYRRMRLITKLLSVLFLLFLVIFSVAGVLLLKHTEDDSHPLEPVWRFLK